jgi:hypothetical protein
MTNEAAFLANRAARIEQSRAYAEESYQADRAELAQLQVRGVRHVSINLSFMVRGDTPPDVVEWMAANLAEHAEHEFGSDYEPDWNHGFGEDGEPLVSGVTAAVERQPEPAA